MTRSKKVETTSESLTTEEVWSVLQFAQQLYTGIYPGAYSPQVVNQRMMEVTLAPQIATSDRIDKALSNPRSNEQELIGYTQWMELNSMMFKRILAYFSGLMSWDWTYVCKNAEKEDYTKVAYIKDLNIFRDFIDKFNVKQEFQVVLKEMMRSEAYFGVLREDGQKDILQELDQQYCIITGRSDVNLLFDFNMVYFLSPNTSLDLFPPIFKKMYFETFYDTGGKLLYNPATSILNRDSTFAQWHQTSPVDGFACFKISSELASRVPWASSLLPAAVIEPVIRALQTNSYIQGASKIIFSEVPMLKETQAKLKDQFAISPDLLGKFLSLVQSAIPSAIKVATAPVVNTKGIEFSGNDKLYSSYLQNLAASSGTNSRLLYSIDRQNILETKLSTDIDLNILRPVYHQFADFLEFHINRKTKKYKFKIIFDGFETSLNREDRFNNAAKLAEMGIVLEQNFASALGINPFDFRRMMEEAKANKFVDKLTPIIKASQMSGKESAGRPQSADSKLGESGAETRGSGADEEKNQE